MAVTATTGLMHITYRGFGQHKVTLRYWLGTSSHLQLSLCMSIHKKERNHLKSYDSRQAYSTQRYFMMLHLFQKAHRGGWSAYWQVVSMQLTMPSLPFPGVKEQFSERRSSKQTDFFFHKTVRLKKKNKR